jgi:hypothetical protein
MGPPKDKNLGRHQGGPEVQACQSHTIFKHIDLGVNADKFTPSPTLTHQASPSTTVSLIASTASSVQWVQESNLHRDDGKFILKNA